MPDRVSGRACLHLRRAKYVYSYTQFRDPDEHQPAISCGPCQPHVAYRSRKRAQAFRLSHCVSGDMASAKHLRSDVCKKLRSEEVVNGFFRELEAIPFPKDKLRGLYPELTETWDVTAKLQSVPWEWVLACELSLSGLLAPTACLYPQQSISIYALTWLFLLRPGSTQTSGLLRLFAGKINLCLGSGSLEGEGKVAAQPHNLGRSGAFMTEGKRFFSWLSAEGAPLLLRVRVLRFRVPLHFLLQELSMKPS